MEEELGTRLPEEIEVKAVEESAQTIYLVLPSSSPIGGGELFDQDLKAVAGGGGTYWGATCLEEPRCNWPS